MFEAALPLDALIGRDAEVDSIEDLLVSTRLVTISGLGGLGKTRIALSVADRWRARGDVVIVDLSAVTRGELVPDRIASSLGLDDQAGLSADEAVIDALASRSCLLLLDEFERVLSAAGFVRALVSRAPGVSVLVTSRVALGLAGEREVPLTPLALPASDAPDAIRASPAAILFLREAQRIGSRIEGTDLPAVRAICQHLAGIPLGILLAAPRTRLFSPRALAKRLAADLPTLPRSSDGSDALGHVLGWTIDLLASPDRDRFVDLAIVPGSFDLSLAAAIWSDADAVELLDTLVRLGLVSRVAGPGTSEDRFELMVPVRDEARRRLSIRGDEVAVMDRMADHIEERSATWQRMLRGRDQVAAAAEIADDLDTIRAVLDALTAADPPRAARIVILLDTFWTRHSLREGRSWALAILDRPRIDMASTVRLRGVVAMTELILIGPEPAMQHATIMLELALAAPSEELEMEARFMLGLASGAAGLFDRSIAELRASAEIASSLGRHLELTRILGNLGITYADTGNLDLASASLSDAVSAARRIEDEFALAMNLVNLAETLLVSGATGAAGRAADEAWTIFNDFDPSRHTVFAMIVRSGALAATGSPAEARDLLATAARLTATVSGAEGNAQLLEYAAFQRAAEGRPREAARLLGTALRSWRSAGQSDDPADHVVSSSLATKLRASLGDNRFAQAVDRGRGDQPERVTERLAGEAANVGDGLLGRYGRLSPREQEVLVLIAQGAVDGDIANHLAISPKTASVHVSNLKNKLGSDTRIQLALDGRRLLDARAGSTAQKPPSQTGRDYREGPRRPS